MAHLPSPTHRMAFSLVELSIVLVILGLLVGGILAGQSLIRASELRSVTSDLTRFKTVIAAFKDKYLALPGDITNAVTFWGAADGGNGIGLDCYETNSTGLPTTCNGDGDGLVLWTNTAVGNEKFRFWQHLANAGMIEGTYSGRAGEVTGAATRMVPINFAGYVPLSKLSSGGYDVWSVGTVSSTVWSWDGYYGLAIYFGATDRDGGVGDLLEGWILTPEEQWNIDTKIDDGKPSYGTIRAYKNSTNCNTNVSQATAVYRLDVSGKYCFIVYSTGF